MRFLFLIIIYFSTINQAFSMLVELSRFEQLGPYIMRKRFPLIGIQGKRWLCQNRTCNGITLKTKHPSIKVRDLSLIFNNKPIFEDLDFSAEHGDKVTIVGENGVGKSTFLRALTGDVTDYTGAIHIQGKVAYLPQSFENFENQVAMDHLITCMGNDSLIELLNETNGARSNIWYQEFNKRGGYSIWSTLSKLQITQQHLERNFFDLSGGEKVKIHLCSLCHQNPDILLLDEPTNHLDSVGLVWLEQFLRAFSGSVVMITHDRALINNTSNKISELSPITHQFSHFRGGYKNYLNEQNKLHTLAKREHIRQKATIKQLTSFVDKLGFAQNRAVTKKIKKLKDSLIEVPEARKAADFFLSEDPIVKPLNGDIHITVENLSKRFEKIVLFNSFNFFLKNKDRLIITGHNGRGKTTLLKMLHGSILPDSGSIKLSENAIIGFLDQEQETLDLSKSPFQVISEIPPGFSTNNAAVAFLKKFGIHDQNDLFTCLNDLSIGCRRKLQLAQIIRQGANVLLLDEPTNHIDLPSIEKIEECLLNFPGIVIAVSHDRYFIKKTGSRIINLE